MLSKDELYKKIRKLAFSIARELPIQINPNTLTLLGFLFALLAGLSFALREVFCAMVFVFTSGFLDLLDGAVAEANDKRTEFGGVLDSVSDRYADAAIIAGIMWGYSLNLSALWFAIGFFSAVGSIMVSYTRARGENVINEKVTIGVADRPARIIIIVIGVLLNYVNYAILAIAILSVVTVLQRLQFIRKSLSENLGKTNPK